MSGTKPSKSVRSGLASVKRDWSDSQTSSQEVLIPWEPTQRPAQPTRTLTGSEARLKAIQEALAGHRKSPPPTQSKRASPKVEPAMAPPKKRARQLPPDWDNVLSGPSIAHAKRSKSQNSTFPSTSTTSNTTTAKKGLASVFLSQEQTKILKLVQAGHSVFYTGSAGTGKSVLLREIIKTLRQNLGKTSDAVAITASTGIAACNIGGVTIHSFAGIGLGIDSAEILVERIRKNKKSATRWNRTKVLIIDEVSMLDGDLFDKLETIARRVRRSDDTFGGIQLVVTGDFFQLPPVSKGVEVKFAFEANTWNTAVKHTYNLTKVFRQSDQTFINMLNEMRFGSLSANSIEQFYALSREVKYEDGIGATELFPRREDVQRSNTERMHQLKTDEQVFKSIDGGSLQDPAQRAKLLLNFMAPHELQLRVDAQVMLIKNLDDTLVNGSMGRIVRFVDPAIYNTEADREQMDNEVVHMNSATNLKKNQSNGIGAKLYPVVEFVLPNNHRRKIIVQPEIWKVELPNGEVQVCRTQLPLILSWAMSIHKSQGQTLERVKVDLGRVFEKGQAYVALSRATTLSRLQVLNFRPAKVQAHPKVVEWTKTLSVVE